MRIQLSGLPAGPQTFVRQCPAENYLGSGNTFPEDILVRATVQMEGNSLRLDLETELPGHFICDRCGKEFHQLHRCRERFFFTFEEKGMTTETQDAAIIPENALELDISQEIRDMVILSLPSQLVCREGCLGLCPVCGADLNKEKCDCRHETFDPRWEALRKLKNKNSSNTS